MKSSPISLAPLAAAIAFFATSANAATPTIAPTPTTESSKSATPQNPVPPTSTTQTLFNLTDPTIAAKWSATDDRVMGGISRSRLRFDAAGYAVFEGVMSLEQNGGFASVRAETPPLLSPTLANVTHYVVEVRGDGKRYKLNMRMSSSSSQMRAVSQVSYQATFQTVKDRWTTVAIPVNSFTPTFRGQLVRGAPPLDAARVNQVGLMISDGQDGAFELAIRRIEVEGR